MAKTTASTFPEWLDSLVERMLVTHEWPNATYPSIAFEVIERIGADHDIDGHASLLQVLIDEIERLREVVGECCRFISANPVASDLGPWADRLCREMDEVLKE